MKKKRKESLIGYTEKGWELYQYQDCWYKKIKHTEITKDKKAYTDRKNPVKIRITMEEI